MRRVHPFLAVAALLATTIMSGAEITLPPESARLVESPLSGYKLATTYCYTCHSTDYIRYQPVTMTRAAWKASVVKMQKVFRAPIPDEVIDPIAEYLVKTYGAERAQSSGLAPQPPMKSSSTSGK
jgi:hypothetical protein